MPETDLNQTDLAAIEALFSAETRRLMALTNDMAAGNQPIDSAACVLALAVSGGPDSMALLALAHNHVRNDKTISIVAATIDHQLRAGSAKEADMVADYCRRSGIDHQILHPPSPITGNIQSSARKVRYQLLQDWAAVQGAQWIMTAHHADDQLETVLMRLNRGSGVAGMASIRAYHDGEDDAVALIRPLLPLTKKQLLDYVAAHNIPYVHDPSNQNRDFDRVKMRQALEACDWLDPLAANRTAQALDQANQALIWAGDHFAKSNLRCHKDYAEITPDDLPQDIMLRLVFLALQHIRPDYLPRGSALERVVIALRAGQTTTQGDILCRAKGKIWHFASAPPRKT